MQLISFAIVNVARSCNTLGKFNLSKVFSVFVTFFSSICLNLQIHNLALLLFFSFILPNSSSVTSISKSIFISLFNFINFYRTIILDYFLYVFWTSNSSHVGLLTYFSVQVLWYKDFCAGVNANGIL